VELTGCQWDELLGWLHHDDDAEIYLNAVLASRWSESRAPTKTSPSTVAAAGPSSPARM
jgi:hypothetical protein